MVQYRKPSSITYSNHLQTTKVSLESRLRSMFSKRGIVYGCTALIILLLFSLMITGIPDRTDASSIRASNGDEFPQTSIPTTPAAIHDVIHDPDFDTMETTHETHIPPPSPAIQGNQLTKDGFPLISTQNNGRVVLLTGATGPGNFGEAEGFYSKTVNNRLEYVNAHGTVLHEPADIGYDLMTVDLSSYAITHTTHAVWGKLPAIIEACEKYPHAEWIWWLDVDAIIMTPEIDLFQHLLSPQILQTKIVQGDPILILNDDFVPVDSGLRTNVSL